MPSGILTKHDSLFKWVACLISYDLFIIFILMKNSFIGLHKYIQKRKGVMLLRNQTWQKKQRSVEHIRKTSGCNTTRKPNTKQLSGLLVLLLKVLVAVSIGRLWARLKGLLTNWLSEEFNWKNTSKISHFQQLDIIFFILTVGLTFLLTPKKWQ